MAPLVLDPMDDVQLEAIAAELSFFLVEPVSSKRRVALVVEVRSAGIALAGGTPVALVTADTESAVLAVEPSTGTSQSNRHSGVVIIRAAK